MKNVLIIIGILLLINISFLSLVSNFNAGFVFLGIAAAGTLLYALYFEKLTRKVHIIICAICLIPLAIMVFLAIYGNINTAKYDEDVVIVLGAGIRGEIVTLPLARRLDEAAKYYDKNPDSIIIVTGGQGFQETITEALAMERYLIAKGVPHEKIIKEEKSTSTYENLVFTKAILDEHFPQGLTSVVITNDFHVYRAIMFAKREGINARHMGASTEWYNVPINYLRETVAVIKAWIIPPQEV